MSNRLFAILVLVIFFGGIYGVYYYFFVSNVGNLKLDVGSFTGVTVELNGEFKNQYRLTCDNVCLINKIPPISYSMTISKSGYKSQQSNIKILRGKTLNLKQLLQKNVYIKEISVDKNDKISLLKFNKESSDNESGNEEKVNIGVKDGVVYFYKFNPGFGLYSYENGEEKNIFLLGEKIISKIYFNKNDGLILINSKDESYVYDLGDNMNHILNIKDDFVYVKKTLDENKILLKTLDSIYIYDLKTNTGIKNTVYNDYVIIGNDIVVGLINKSDKGKLSVLNFKDNGTDKLILNNISSRDRKIVFETSLNIKFIEYTDKKIIITDEDGKEYEVKELSPSF